LNIYHVSGDNVSTNTVGDKTAAAGTATDKSFLSEPHVTPGKLQALNEQFRETTWNKGGCGGHR
jgi:hypothetical protein